MCNEGTSPRIQILKLFLGHQHGVFRLMLRASWSERTWYADYQSVRTRKLYTCDWSKAQQVISIILRQSK